MLKTITTETYAETLQWRCIKLIKHSISLTANTHGGNVLRCCI